MRPMTRRFAMLAAAAVTVGSLGLAAVAELHGATAPPSPTASPAAAYAIAAHQGLPAAPPGRPGPDFAACEQQLDRAQLHGLPRLAVLGASFTAGVGSSPGQSWAVVLARHLHWDAVVYGVPGAGYVRGGVGRGGPVAAEVAHAGLRALAPSLIIVQVGHDDIGVPAALERQRVTQAITTLRAQAPAARIVLLTVFPGRSAQAAAYRTDHAIVTAAQTADPAVIIIDPLTGKWIFPHIRDGLHPTAAGSAWIASQVGSILDGHGVRPAPAGAGPAPIICDHA
jgi:lysophospholipase L1-like esterase